MLRITFEPLGRPSLLEPRWRALEAQAEPDFFRSWTFLGCLADERFANARLLGVTQDGSDVGLALLGEARGRLWLNQTGVPALDAPFIEHNGLLALRGTHPTTAALRQVVRYAPVTLAGIGENTHAAASNAGWLVTQRTQWAPSVRLDLIGGAYLDTLSAGTRAQIRRSQRAYGEAPQLERADSPEQARDWFEEMCKLHQAAWQARGQPGAFATPELRRFHATLIARGWPRDEVDLLRVSSGSRVLGLLYTFIQGGHVLSYQSGFAFDPARPREKPGLVSHALAVEHYRALGAHRYDFLAGADRYKTALARDGEALHWATLHRPWSASGLAARARLAASDIRTRLES